MAGNVTNSVRALREKKGMTQEGLAAALGVSRQTVIAVERCKYVPSLPLAMAIGKLFRLPVEKIFRLE